MDFDASTSACQRLIDILSKLNDLLGEGNRPKLRAHDAIHLVLLVDSLWMSIRDLGIDLPSAQDKFSEALARAAKTKNDQNPEEAWLRYGVWPRNRHCHPKAGAAKEFAVQVLKKTAKSLDSQALPAEGDLPAEAQRRRHATPAAVTQIMERIGYDASDPTDRDRALKAAWREAARSGLIPYERARALPYEALTILSR